MTPENARVDEYLIHPLLRARRQDQGRLDPSQLATLCLHRFPAVQVLTAELQDALRGTRTVQDCCNAPNGSNVLIRVPTNMALIRNVHHVGCRRIVGLDGVHQKMLICIAARAPEGFIGWRMCFVRDSGRWLSRHGFVPLHQKVRDARLHELNSLGP